MPATTLTDRAVIRLSGEDVRDFLQGLVTQDVTGALPVWAGLLSAQGKCLFDFLVWADGDDLLIDCEADSRRRPHQAAVDLPAAPADYDRSRRRLCRSIGPPKASRALPTLALRALGKRWLGPAGEPASGWLEHRLRLGVCEGRAELGELLWLECNAAELNGVSFSKGCFVGQENTARMNWRQKINRRLLVVEGDGGERTRTAYPELGLAVVHARVDDIPPNAIIPPWLESGSQLSIAKARTGNVPMPLILGGTAEKRKPLSGSWPSPVRCSPIGIPAPSSKVWTGVLRDAACRRYCGCRFRRRPRRPRPAPAPRPRSGTGDR